MTGPTVSRSPSSPLMVLGAFALLWWVIAALVSLAPAWKQVELKLLDSMTVASAPNKSVFPITVVGIDEPSFAELGLQWPWPRRLHAELIDRLAEAGAAVIVFDIVFSEPSNKADDKRFAEAIRRAGNVVMAADRVYRESSSIRQWTRLDPYQAFTDAGAQADLFATPFLASTGWLTPGAEVHANIIETALARNAITRLPTGVVIALLGMPLAIYAPHLSMLRCIDRTALYSGS